MGKNRKNQASDPRMEPLPLRLLPPLALPNGTEVVPAAGRRGLGILTVINGTTFDAVAKLVADLTPPATYRAVYVRASGTVTLSGVPSGPYMLKFASGTDWDHQTKRFRRDQTYSQFAEAFPFIEEPDGDTTRYQTFEVTLHPVPHGTAS